MRFSITRIPFPWAATAMLLVALFLEPLAAAQTKAPTRTKERGPRAVSVIEWLPDAEGRARARMLPAFILDQGKYQDASVYRATPRPMSLDPGVVYEAQFHGEPIGLFTVESASRQQTHWAAVGAWKSTAPQLDTGSKATQSAQVRGTDTPNANGDDQDDRDQKRRTTVFDEQGREIPADQAGKDEPQPKKGKYPEPIDRRPRVAKPGEGIPPSQRTGGQSTGTTDTDSDRPRLKKNAGGQEQTKADTPDTAPEPATGTASTPADTASSSSDDPGRPKLHRGPARPASQPAAEAQPAAPEDPNRPIIRRRGSESAGAQKNEQLATAPIPLRAKESGGRRIGDTEKKAYDVVAVSDAEQSADSHSYAFRMSPEERDDDLKKVAALARKEVDQFRQSRYPAAKPMPSTTKRGATPRAPQNPVFNWSFSDERFVALDLFTNNTPELIYSARVEPEALASKSAEVFVTVVATIDPEGKLEKIFSTVTDTTRLDVTPRVEFVDAVDSDGKGRGDLLFRRSTGSDSEFVLYRVAGNSLQELFHGGWAGE